MGPASLHAHPGTQRPRRQHPAPHEAAGRAAPRRPERVSFCAGASASPLKILCTPEGIRLQCFLKYYTDEMRVNWYHK